MLVRGLNNTFVTKEKTSSKKITAQPDTSKSTRSNSLPFLSIPDTAFASRLISPALPVTFKPAFTSSQPVTNFKVYPHNPSISKLEIMKLKGKVLSGPENERFITVDSSKPAVANKDGHFICSDETPQFDRINAFFFAAKTLEMYEDSLKRKINWFLPDQKMKIYPLAGKKINSGYDKFKGELKFYYFDSKREPGETCFIARSADCVCHETGHAILDGLKPSYIGWGGFGSALHEGFADISAILMALNNEKIIDQVIKDTGGDLRKPNIVSTVGEYVGKSAFTSKDYLRESINDYKLSDFEGDNYNKEEHDFGHLITGTFYDILVEMTSYNKKSSGLKEAIVQTQKDLTRIVARTFGDFSPPGYLHYYDFSKALLQTDKTDFNGKYHDIIVDILKTRELIKPKHIKDWKDSQAKLPDLKLTAGTVDSKEAILKLINTQKEVLSLSDKLKYKVENAYTNEAGETFLQLTAKKYVDMKYGNSTIPMKVLDGLTLGFDDQNMLFYMAQNIADGSEIQEELEHQ